jgi:hypothetical protein
VPERASAEGLVAVNEENAVVVEDPRVKIAQSRQGDSANGIRRPKMNSQSKSRTDKKLLLMNIYTGNAAHALLMQDNANSNQTQQ